MILDKNTINTENFCDLTLAEYWEKYRFTIANERGWECKGERCPSSRAGCSKLFGSAPKDDSAVKLRTL